MFVPLVCVKHRVKKDISRWVTLSLPTKSLQSHEKNRSIKLSKNGCVVYVGKLK